MDESQKKAGASNDDGESLENPSSGSAAGSEGTQSAEQPISATGSSASASPAAPTAKPKGSLKTRLLNSNIYFVLFLFLIVIAAAIAVIAYSYSKKTASKPAITSQSLTDSTLKQLAASDATVGDSKSVLNVQSSAVFAGKVLVRDALEVAGSLQVGGPLTISDLKVSGSTVVGDIQASKDLSVAGNGTVQGQLAVKGPLNVNGSGTFNGALSATQLTVSAFQLNGDLVLTHHITAGGASPSRTNGNALGSGGTASVNGSDTAGSVTINTGGSPSAGCFLTVNFAQKFNSTPRVLITPVGDNAATVPYYVNRNTAGFSICTSSAVAASSGYAFDYFVVN